jgi:ribosomal protein S18 acetylase RimI-like enzyme
MLMEDFNQSESIAFHRARCEAALLHLLDDSSLGFVMVAASDRLLGYTVTTYNYDLEFGGKDAFVTEVYVLPAARRGGIARAMIRAITERARQEDLTALHLAVRPENEAAKRLYQSEDYRFVPRVLMTKLLIDPDRGDLPR